MGSFTRTASISLSSRRGTGASEQQQPQNPAIETREEHAEKLFNTGLILFMILALGILLSLVPPFFPSEAEKKGMSPTIVGFLFGGYELTVFILSAIWGLIAPQIGFRCLFALGSILSGGAISVFGFLNDAPPGDVYIAMCFACRFVEAVGLSMCMTVSFAYASSLFPDKISFIFGLLETANGAGFVIGPLIGGFLYKWGGFALPFLATGILIVILGSISTIFLKPPTPKKRAASFSPFLVLKMPLILVIGICETFCAAIFAFLDPTLSVFLEGLDITDPVVVGANFMICSVAYSLACLFTGKALEWWDVPYLFMIIGTIATCVGYLLIGPSPLIPLFRPTEATIIPACLIGFAGLGFILIPLPKLLTDHLLKKGFPNDIKTNSLVSGIYNGLWHLGAFMGPSAAGAMVDGIGFLWSSTIMALLAAFLCVTLIVTSIVLRTLNRKRTKQIITVSDGEQEKMNRAIVKEITAL